MKMNIKNRKDLQDIAEIKELNQIEDVNNYINLGWKLIGTYEATSTGQHQVIKYCVGWPKSAAKGNAVSNTSKKVDPDVAKKFVYSL